MKKTFIFLVIVALAFTGSAYERSHQHQDYLDSILDPVSIRRDADISRLSRTDTVRNIGDGFMLGFSENFLNAIVHKHVEHEALKDFNLYFRDGVFVIDGVIYFDLLDLDIPFTVHGNFQVPRDNSLYLDIAEAKVWEEGNLPTHVLLEKVIEFVADNTEISKFIYLGYESVSARRYDEYGRIIIIPKLEDIAPNIPDITITDINTFFEEIIIKGK
ncbi:MAG: hypothetical protein ACQESP_02765 [Candidatus Muiribacteriota bacterium]